IAGVVHEQPAVGELPDTGQRAKRLRCSRRSGRKIDRWNALLHRGRLAIRERRTRALQTQLLELDRTHERGNLRLLRLDLARGAETAALAGNRETLFGEAE